jgi:hypothetical protein
MPNISTRVKEAKPMDLWTDAECRADVTNAKILSTIFLLLDLNFKSSN